MATVVFVTKNRHFFVCFSFFYYLCPRLLKSFADLTPQTCSALSYRKDSLRRAKTVIPIKDDPDKVGNGWENESHYFM